MRTVFIEADPADVSIPEVIAPRKEDPDTYMGEVATLEVSPEANLREGKLLTFPDSKKPGIVFQIISVNTGQEQGIAAVFLKETSEPTSKAQSMR